MFVQSPKYWQFFLSNEAKSPVRSLVHRQLISLLNNQGEILWNA
jgi:hypothetical protein